MVRRSVVVPRVRRRGQTAVARLEPVSADLPGRECPSPVGDIHRGPLGRARRRPSRRSRDQRATIRDSFRRWPLLLADEVVAHRRRTGHWLCLGNKGRSGGWATGAVDADLGAHMPSGSPIGRLRRIGWLCVADSRESFCDILGHNLTTTAAAECTRGNESGCRPAHGRPPHIRQARGPVASRRVVLRKVRHMRLAAPPPRPARGRSEASGG